MTQERKNISLNCLQYVFPVDTVWHFNRSEIVGYSISKNLHFVIEDGMCCTKDGMYLLSIYKPSNKKHQTEWIPQIDRDYSHKYIDEEKIIEEWVNFCSEVKRVSWREKINEL